jgi:hypothetical protein
MASTTKSPQVKALPQDALDALLELKKTSSQAAIARRLDVSDAAISAALRGKYIGNVEALAERIRGELLNQTVACPILGEITSRICQDERKKPFHSANPMRVRIWRTCRTCPNNPSANGGES